LIQRPSNTTSGGCAAGENDRREAQRFPALRVRQRFRANAQAGWRPATQENRHDANDATSCDGPATLPEKIVNGF
jgi:hypothetical protein